MDDIRVEVAYATRVRQSLIEVHLPKGATVREAIVSSGILEAFPDLDLDTVETGIYSERVGLETMLRTGDRIEIYRPLGKDPKEARRERARRGAG
ncbi:MAG: RnfH family protein [Gammaproteobacteria bacterium]|nr:RnfH family protein [Gammaproteobacteria bacterium]